MIRGGHKNRPKAVGEIENKREGEGLTGGQGEKRNGKADSYTYTGPKSLETDPIIKRNLIRKWCKMKFSQKEVEAMGAKFYLNGQAPVTCVACGEGEVEFIPVGRPVFGVAQVHDLTCDYCGRKGKHPN